MTWRAQAILRTINALQQLLPISDVVITNQDGRIRYSIHDTNLRQRLIEAYGILVNGERQPICAYCGTTKGSFVVDHVVPQSRGGTDAWSNVVLACARCNARKADRTPEEAGMVIRHQHQVFCSNRAGIYRSATRVALEYGLSQKQLRVHAETIDPNIAALITDVQNTFTTPSPHSPPIIAKVIARGAKQRYTARNYPKTTTLKPGWEWRGTAVKRRTRVNSAMLIYRSKQKTIVKVVPEGKAQAVDPGGIEVHTGMLCEGKRASQFVTGIVVAIESSGRLRLLVPKSIEAGRVRWQRIVISPRQHLRVLANEPVVFLRSATS